MFLVFFLIYFLPAGNTDESQLWEVHCSCLCILLINISLLGHVRSLALRNVTFLYMQTVEIL